MISYLSRNMFYFFVIFEVWSLHLWVQTFRFLQLPDSGMALALKSSSSAVSHSRHVRCVTQQTCLLFPTADMSALSHSRHICSVTQQACLRYDSAQTCLLCHTADMSAV